MDSSFDHVDLLHGYFHHFIEWTGQMTPSEKLKEIEKTLQPIRLSKFIRIQYSQDAINWTTGNAEVVENISWLLFRVKRLTSALEEIRDTFEIDWSEAQQIARKALSESEE